MSNTLYAVITGDIYKSSRMKNNQMNRLAGEIKRILAEISDFAGQRQAMVKYSVFRGDSFQIITQPEWAFTVIVYLRAGLRTAFPSTLASATDCRIALAIGPVQHFSENITESIGEAFTVSGRLLETMHKSGFLEAQTPLPEITHELNTEFALCNEIIRRWTTSQSQLVPMLLRNETQVNIAESLGVSQASIAQKIQAMGWYPTEILMVRYQQLMTRFINI